MKITRLVLVGVWVGILTITSGLLIPRALNAPTISLEEYRVVLKPGRIMSTKDSFLPELRNKFARLARDFAVLVPLNDLLGKIQSHEIARKRRIAAVNRRWSFTKSPSGWPVFRGMTSMIMILGVGYLIYRCCRTGYRVPVSMAMA